MHAYIYIYSLSMVNLPNQMEGSAAVVVPQPSSHVPTAVPQGSATWPWNVWA